MGTGPSWDQFSSPSIRQLTKTLCHCSARPRASQAAILAAPSSRGPMGTPDPGVPVPQTQQLCLQTQALLRVGTSTHTLNPKRHTLAPPDQ